MHEREVSHVEEVFHHPQPRGGNADRAGADDAAVRFFELGNGQNSAWLRGQRHPEQAVDDQGFQRLRTVGKVRDQPVGGAGVADGLTQNPGMAWLANDGLGQRTNRMPVVVDKAVFF